MDLRRERQEVEEANGAGRDAGDTTAAAAPATAQTINQDDSDPVAFPACFPFCEDNSFEDGFFLVSSDEGVFSDGDFDDGYIDFDGNNRDDHDYRNGGGNGRR